MFPVQSFEFWSGEVAKQRQTRGPRIPARHAAPALPDGAVEVPALPDGAVEVPALADGAVDPVDDDEQIASDRGNDASSDAPSTNAWLESIAGDLGVLSDVEEDDGDAAHGAGDGSGPEKLYI